MSEPNRALGLHFFTSMDQRRGGPDPAICDPGFTAKVNGRSLDLAEYSGMVASFYAAFPDLNHLIEDTVADEERVAVRTIVEGTQTGDLMGMTPTGRRISIESVSILEAKGGKVRELRGVFDQAGMMQQLGGS